VTWDHLRHVAPRKAGDKRRGRPIVDLLRRADLGDASGIEDHDAVGHHHRFLAIVRDMHGRDAEPLLQCLDLVSHILAGLPASAGRISSLKESDRFAGLQTEPE